jgi:tetrapyrrole methylase family protein/MazG family protein/ATP diphosphatase
MLQVLFYAEMAREDGRFSIDDVLDALSHKLISRHPHVFGDVKAEDAGQVLRNWEALKAEEKRKKIADTGSRQPETLLGGVSTKMPALLEAYKISSKAAQAGFDWPEIAGLFEKLTEETQELQANLAEMPAEALRAGHGVPVPEALARRIEDEVGDLFFVLVNIARYLNVDPEAALRRTNRKFRRRFGWLEEQLHDQGKKPGEATLEEMESLWQQAKNHEETR